MSIKPLNKETIKLINSTQVISSIYSAVKELVENSLDANAQNVEVNLVDNGLSLIEIKDNGIGINKENANFMALSTYTSKINDFNDLDSLSTYGFRGEGLNAICQVSDVTICTKTASDETMICYTLSNDGQIITSELSHGLTGTTVQMRNIFKNMPVRRNILNNKRRINQEIKAVELLLKMYAICKPCVRFVFRVNSNVVFSKPSCKNISEAIKSCFGIQTFSKLIYIKKVIMETEIELFVPQKDCKDCVEICQVGLQFICVNDRPVKSIKIEKTINKRISEFFDQSSSNSRKFIFCLKLLVPPSMLDINLEPNKDKVFLQNETAILEEIDKLLLSLYEIDDTQKSIQNNVEHINVNGKENLKEKEKEKEWPACKKRKIYSEIENVCEINKKQINSKEFADDNIKLSDNDFLKSINGPVLSESDSNDGDEFAKKHLDHNNEPIITGIRENENGHLSNNKTKANKLIRDQDKETLSQLPKVDLGEDFNLQEIVEKSYKKLDTIHKNNDICEEVLNVDFSEDFDLQEIVNKSNEKSESSNKYNETTREEEINTIKWSKGQVPGLQGGVAIGMFKDDSNKTSSSKETENNLSNSELFDFMTDQIPFKIGEELESEETMPQSKEFEINESITNFKNMNIKKIDKSDAIKTSKQRKKSLNTIHDDPTQTKIPFAGDNACLNFMGPSAFAMFCSTVRAKIVKQNPMFTPAEVAIHLNKLWKEVTPEEREYYRDIANQHNQSKSSTETKKLEASETENEKNKKQLISMLKSMKSSRAEMKKENMIMRTSVPWEINISSVTEKFKENTPKEKEYVVGSINDILWIIIVENELFIFDITDIQKQLNLPGVKPLQINMYYVEDLIERWFKEKKDDMSIFHSFYSIKK